MLAVALSFLRTFRELFGLKRWEPEPEGVIISEVHELKTLP
jgi:hypothetical protein